MLDRERLQRVLGGSALAALRQRLRGRYQDGGPEADVFTLTRLGPAEAEALAGLLGRQQKARASMRLSHTALDTALAGTGIADNLRAALEALDGPIANPQTARAARERAWTQTMASATQHELAQWLAQPQAQGLLKRLAGSDAEAGRRLLTDVQRVLARLPAAGIALARLAANTLGDAHGLDKNQPVATLVLHVLAVREGVLRPRELWATQGVMVNELAKPVVTLNLVAGSADPLAELLATAAAAGEPLHLSLHQLSRHAATWQPGQAVFVCENPTVLAAAADALGAACPPMISLDGQLSAAPRVLLDQLAAAGARFRYHGDFDWGGLRIANFFFQRYGGTPWRFRAFDYRPEGGPVLVGDPVAACWDEALAPRMQAAGRAVHEESVLAPLLDDLSGQ